MGHGNYVKNKISSVPMGKEIRSENLEDVHYLWFSIKLNPLLSV